MVLVVRFWWLVVDELMKLMSQSQCVYVWFELVNEQQTVHQFCLVAANVAE